MEITATAVKALRDKLGPQSRFSMVDCKKALVEENGDEEKAIQILWQNDPYTRMIAEGMQKLVPGSTYEIQNGNINLYPDKR
jgi:translation elongation factor EF-Ts